MGCSSSKPSNKDDFEEPLPTLPSNVNFSPRAGSGALSPFPHGSRPARRTALPDAFGGSVQHEAEDAKKLVFPALRGPIGEMVDPEGEGVVSKELGLVIGSYMSQGKREYQEDRFTISVDKKQAFIGVYDGHGGQDVSEILSKELHKHFFETLRSPGGGAFPSMRRHLKDTFNSFDNAIQKRRDAISPIAGSCAVVATLYGDALVLANVGDCEAILCCKGEHKRLSYLHKASDEKEISRVKREKGSLVSIDGNLRLGGLLAVTRAFGGIALKDKKAGLTSQPFLFDHCLTNDDEFLVMGSDGLFDRFPYRQELINVVKKHLQEHKDPSLAARAVVEQAVDTRRSTDNTTCVIVCFNQRGVITSEAGAGGGVVGYAQQLRKGRRTKIKRRISAPAEDVARSVRKMVSSSTVGSDTSDTDTHIRSAISAATEVRRVRGRTLSPLEEEEEKLKMLRFESSGSGHVRRTQSGVLPPLHRLGSSELGFSLETPSEIVPGRTVADELRILYEEGLGTEAPTDSTVSGGGGGGGGVSGGGGDSSGDDEAPPKGVEATPSAATAATSGAVAAPESSVIESKIPAGSPGEDPEEPEEPEAEAAPVESPDDKDAGATTGSATAATPEPASAAPPAAPDSPKAPATKPATTPASVGGGDEDPATDPDDGHDADALEEAARRLRAGSHGHMGAAMTVPAF